MKEQGPTKTYSATLREILALKCLECMGGDSTLVGECDSPDCPLVHARPESRPDGLKKRYWSEKHGRLKALPIPRKRSLSDEQKAAAAERLRNFRAAPVS